MRNAFIPVAVLALFCGCERETKVERQQEQAREQAGEVREEARDVPEETRDVREEAREVGREMREVAPEARELTQERREALRAAAARDGYEIQFQQDGSIVASRAREPVAGGAPSSDQLESAIRENLKEHAPELADKITVKAEEGAITLTGTVKDVGEVSQALRLSLEPRGVDRVVSRLTY